MARVLILSGAGLSAPSGLKTFRGNDGLWENYDVMEVCSVSGYAKNPSFVHKFYDERRAQLKEVLPNKAHFCLAKIKEEFDDQICIMTQNVDDLLERANCKDVIHLHGFLPNLRCKSCGKTFYIGYESQENKICPFCKSKNLRHDIVMFGEAAPMYSVLYNELLKADLFVAIGTSGEVLDVANFAKMVGNSILNNYEKSFIDASFNKVYIQSCETAIFKIYEDIKNFLK